MWRACVVCARGVYNGVGDPTLLCGNETLVFLSMDRLENEKV